MPDPGEHTLVLMRHAKSSWSTHASDHDRPLSKRGQRDARAAGTWLSENDLQPELLLCSPSLRTRQTLDRLQVGGLRPGRVEFREGLYDATRTELLEEVRQVSEETASVQVIGHNGSIEQSVRHLARRRGHREWWQAMDQKFPTSALAVLDVDCAWSALDADCAALRTYQVPRG